MESRVFFLCVVFLCGLSKTDAELSIRLEEDPTHPGFHKFLYSCIASDVHPSAKELDLIQILREEPNKKLRMVAHIGMDRKNTVVYGEGMEKLYKGFGAIDTSIKEDSFLSLTLLDPQVENQGQYVCDIYYKDESGKEKHTKSSAAFKLPKMILQKDTNISSDLKKLQDQIDGLESKNLKKLQDQIYDLASNLTRQEELCKRRVEAHENLVSNIVKTYDKRLNDLFQNVRNQGTVMKKSMNNVRALFNQNLDEKMAELNETFTNLKTGLEKGQGQLETRVKDDLSNHVEMFENVTKDLASNEALSELETRVSNTDIVSRKLASKISQVTDRVNVLQFLVDGSVETAARTTAGPKKGSMAQFASKISTLEQRADDQTLQISDLKKELAETNTTAFSATFSNVRTALLNEVLVFDKVILNKGQAYNRGTGVFTAPRSGVYAFNLVLLTRIAKEWIDVDLEINGQLLVRLTSKETNREDQTTVSTVTPLKAGDEVKSVIKYTDKLGKNKLPHLGFSVFSGFFVQPL